MTDERRYGEDEVREIFEQAALLAENRREAAAYQGLTLAELQSIGMEVGLPPEGVAEAAKALDLQKPGPRGRHFGMPVSVGQVVPLPRLPSLEEWEVLLAEIRTTFRASGRDRSHGNVRIWTNGNLHVFIEPGASGARLRMGTLKANGVAYNWLGLGWIVAAMMGGVGILGGAPLDTPLFLGGLGIGSLLYNRIRLPGWASKREEQMGHIATITYSLLSGTGSTRPVPPSAPEVAHLAPVVPPYPVASS